MNHIYRSLYNKALGTWVAVPEIAKTHGKSAGGKSATFTLPAPRFAVTALAGALLFAFSGQQALAADYVCIDPVTGQPMPPSSVPGAGNEVACGQNAVASGTDAVAIGTNATASGASSAAIGSNAKATATNALAVGGGSQATGVGAAAFGRGAAATNANTVAVGIDSAASEAQAIAIGAKASASKNSNIALGFQANASGNTSAIAIGRESSAAGESAFAGGYKAEARGKNSVSLGSNAGAVAAGTAVNSALLENVVNIGNGAGRNTTSNIHGIAIGDEAGQRVNTAATGGQNIAIGRRAGQDVTGNTNVAISSHAGQHVSGHDNFAALLNAGQHVTGNNNIAIGKQAGSGTATTKMTASDTIALGFQTKATRDGAIALGKQTEAQAVSAVAIGGWGDKRTPLGNRTTISKAPYSVVMGGAAQANEFSDSAVVIGHQAEARGAAANITAKDSVAIGYRSLVTTASNIAIGSNAKADDKSQATAIGNNANAKGYQSIAFGSDARALNGGTVVVGRKALATTAAPNAVAVGDGANVSANAAWASGSYAQTSVAKGVALGAESVASRAALTGVQSSHQADAANNTVYALDNADAADKTAIVNTVVGNAGAVSVGGTYQYTDSNNNLQAGTNTRQIIHVAAGSNDTDAVNVAQLKAVANKTATTPLTVTDGKVTAPAAGSADAGKLATAGDIANAINNSGFTLTAAGQNGSLVKPGATVDLKNTDGNILVSKAAGDNNVNFDLAPTVKIGPSTGGSPITINGAAGTIGGLNNTLPATSSTAPNATTAEAAPTLTSDERRRAATVDDVLNAGWNLQGNGSAKDFVRAYDTVNFVNGTGTTVEVDSDGAVSTIKVNVNAQNLAESAQLPVVYTKANGDKVYKHSDGKFYDKAEGQPGAAEVPVADVIASMQNPDGTTKTPTTLANVKAGVKDTDAVNVSQLKGAAAALGGGAEIDSTTGQFKAPSYTLTNGDPSTGTTKTYNTVGEALVGLNDAVNKPLTFGGDTGTAFDRKLGSTVNVKGGATGTLTDGNIGVVSNGSDTLTVKLAEKIDLGASGSVTTGNTTVNNDGLIIANANPTKIVRLTSEGLNNGGNKITNVADGTNPNDAVNFGQLQKLQNTVNGGWDIGNGAKVGSVKPGSRVDFVAANSNTKVNVSPFGNNNENFKVEIAAAPSPLQYTSSNNPDGSNTPNADQFNPTNAVTLVGTGNAAVTINNVAPGKVAANSKQAVNGGQLHAHGEGVKNIIGGTTTYNPDNGTYSNTNIGGTGKDNIHDAIDSIRSTAAQAAKPLNFKGDSGDTVVASPGDTVTITGGEGDPDKLSNGKNIGVDAKDGSDILNIKLAKDLTDLASAQFKDGAGDTTKIDADGITIDPAAPNKPNVSLTADGLDNGGNRITNVAPGLADSDAATVGQLRGINPVVNNITNIINNTTVSAGDNMQVTQQGDNYQVTIAPDISLNSVTTGPVTMSAEGLSINGNTYVDANGLNANGQTIRNVGAGRIAPDSMDAVNGAQLHALGQHLDHRVGNLENALGDVDKRARAGIASAMASAGLPQAYRPGASMVAASAGHYDGQTAIAIGASTISDNGRWILKGTLNVNSKDAGATVGVGYQW